MSLKKFQFVQEDLKNLFSKVNPKSLAGLKNKTFFITGCSGFVGIWLCETINYLNEKHDFNIYVYGLDSNLERLKLNAPHLLNLKNFELSRGDIRHISELPKKTNYLIHAAGHPDSRMHATSPVEVLNSAATGLDNILKAADRLGELLMFVNVSSGSVYGDFESRTAPIKETDALTVRSQSAYISGKIYSEALTNSYRQQYRIPSLILRPFTFVGPFQALSSPWALNTFIQDALSGSAIKVLGTGQTTRSFLYGSDVAFWILKMTLEGQSGEVYNLGSPEAVDLKTAASYVNQSFMQSKEIIFCAGNSSQHKTNVMVPDNSLVQSKFGLKPTYTPQEAIKRSVDWYSLENNQV
ncbi:MAG: NAD-dependent epimerase/dehydratase family protein [Pseudobdellovibrio sp.]